MPLPILGALGLAAEEALGEIFGGAIEDKFGSSDVPEEQAMMEDPALYPLIAAGVLSSDRLKNAADMILRTAKKGGNLDDVLAQLYRKVGPEDYKKLENLANTAARNEKLATEMLDIVEGKSSKYAMGKKFLQKSAEANRGIGRQNKILKELGKGKDAVGSAEEFPRWTQLGNKIGRIKEGMEVVPYKEPEQKVLKEAVKEIADEIPPIPQAAKSVAKEVKPEMDLPDLPSDLPPEVPKGIAKPNVAAKAADPQLDAAKEMVKRQMSVGVSEKKAIAAASKGLDKAQKEALKESVSIPPIPKAGDAGLTGMQKIAKNAKKVGFGLLAIPAAALLYKLMNQEVKEPAPEKDMFAEDPEINEQVRQMFERGEKRGRLPGRDRDKILQDLERIKKEIQQRI